MQHYRAMSILCVLVMSTGIGCAPSLKGPTAPSGYLFSLQTSASQIWIERTPDSLVYPSAATLVVQVQDAQGRKIGGVPVSFRVHDVDTPEALLTPVQDTTPDGIATALFQPTAIGMYYLTAQVEQTSQKVTIYVNRRDLCCFCQVWPPGHDCGRAP